MCWQTVNDPRIREKHKYKGENIMKNFLNGLGAAVDAAQALKEEDMKKNSFFNGVAAAMNAAKITEQANGFVEGMITELAYANGKHPGWPADDAVHASAILNEEAGKLTQASIDHTYGYFPTGGTTARMKQKALRVAAMALRFYASIPEYKQLKA